MVASDDQGRFEAFFPFVPLGHFSDCVTEDEILSILSENQLAPELQRVDLAFEHALEQYSLDVDVTEELLRDFRPWDHNELDVGMLILVNPGDSTN